MKNKKVIYITVLVSLIVFGLSALWHFIFAIMPTNFMAIIFPVNESPWEHAKLLFFPAIIGYVILYYYYGKSKKNFLYGHAISLLVMPVVMFALFYGYRSIGIDEMLIIDIIITFIVIILGSYIGYRISHSERDYKNKSVITYTIPIALFILLTTLTFVQPKISLFQHSHTGEYGILEHYDEDDHDH